MNPDRHLDAWSAGALVVASMIGVGVFTTAGYQAADLDNAPAILFAWVLGGLAAGCGSLAYAELASAIPDNGGEMSLLSRIYHPRLGLAAGLVSLVAGFTAPLAATAIAFEQYAAGALGFDPPGEPLALGLLLIAALGPALGATIGDRMQRWLTLGKVGLLLVVITGGLFAGEPSRLLAQSTPFGAAVSSSAFAVGLVYVSYAYTGWNAAAYVAGEVENPELNLPRALIGGTAVVTVLYLAVHAALLGLAPLEVLAGQVEVADAAARHSLGPRAAAVLSAVIAFGLWSTASALITTGVAVASAMGERTVALRWTRTATGSTWPAVLALTGGAALLVLTAGFDTILTYIGVTLGFFSGLAVFGVFVLRWRQPDLKRPYRTWGHPFTTLFHLMVVGWMISFVVIGDWVVGVVGLITILLALAFAGLGRR